MKKQKKDHGQMGEDSRNWADELIVIRDIKISVSRKEVFQMLHCTPESASHGMVEELYGELLEDTVSAMAPVLMIRLGKIPEGYPQIPLKPGTQVIYTIGSIGGEVSRRSTAAFAEGDPVAGMLLNAIADSALFHLDDELAPILKQVCGEHRKGIQKRLEAPQDLPMEAQLLIYRETEAARICGMGISTGYMLDPVKSSANLYLLTDDVQVFQAQHDCSTCTRKNCSLRKGKHEKDSS